MELVEQIAGRVINGNDREWGMNIHRFDWAPGVGLYGIWKAYEATGREEYLTFLIGWADCHLQEAYAQKTVNSTAPLLTVLELYKETRKESYLTVCRELADDIIANAPRTADGGLEHTVTENVEAFHDQMWADTLFMACIFLARLGQETGEKKYTDFAVCQLKLHQSYLWEEKEGLFYHAWNGAKRNHMSSVFWGRANAWILYSTVEILKAAGDFDGREQVCRILKEHAEALRKWQRPDGLFGTIINDPDAYSEVSASAGIAAGIRSGVREGYLDASYLDAADSVRRTLLEYVDEKGTVLGVSGGTAVKESAEAYKKVAIIPTLYGQALAILALI